MKTGSNNSLSRLLQRIIQFFKNVWRHPAVKVVTGLVVAIGAISAFGAAFGLPSTWWIPAFVGTPVARALATSIPTSFPTLAPTVTPLEGTPFASNVIGVVLADFTQGDSDAPNIADPLGLALEQQNIPLIRVHHPLADRAEAQRIAAQYKATIVVWGESYKISAQVYFDVDPTHSKAPVTMNGLLLAIDDHFSAFVTYEGMGVPYLLDFTQGQMLLFDGQYSDALDAFSAAVQLIPIDQEAEAQAEALFMYRGFAYGYLGKYDDALADDNRALQLDPNDAGVYNNRGNIYSKQGRNEDALADLSRALQLQPNDVEAYNNRGIVYANQSKYDDALADLNRALQLQPNDLEAYNNRGNVYRILGKYDEALTDLNRALQLQPNVAEVYDNRGLVYGDLGKYDKALVDFNYALQLNPDDAKVYEVRGITYYHLDNYEQAIADYQTYQRLTGKLEPFMQQQIIQMQAALTATPEVTETPSP